VGSKATVISVWLLVGTVVALSGFDADGTAIKRIYVAPMSYLDIGFTDAPSTVASKMVATVNEALDQADKDPDYVWNVETFWQLDQWLATRPSADHQERLVERVRSGRFGVGAAYVTPHISIMSDWALGRAVEAALAGATETEDGSE
jgi:hypothetical protein